ncbi:MAG TPA: NAD(P)H-dependent oxidoreductase subunit E [Spirochaetia bacterium]
MGVAEIVEKRGNTRESLLQILHDLQDQSGDNSLHASELETLAKITKIPVAEIVSTASFYTMFSFRPRGRHLIRLCESPPCWVMGEENILAALEAKLGISVGETSPDRLFTLETTSCLGACGVGPVMMIDGEVYGNLTPDRVEEIVDRLVHDSERVAGPRGGSAGGQR